jgi:hypothetical protein
MCLLEIWDTQPPETLRALPFTLAHDSDGAVGTALESSEMAILKPGMVVGICPICLCRQKQQNNNPHNKKDQKHPQTTILSPLINPTETKKNPIQTLTTKILHPTRIKNPH